MGGERRISVKTTGHSFHAEASSIIRQSPLWHWHSIGLYYRRRMRLIRQGDGNNGCIWYSNIVVAWKRLWLIFEAPWILNCWGKTFRQFILSQKGLSCTRLLGVEFLSGLLVINGIPGFGWIRGTLSKHSGSKQYLHANSGVYLACPSLRFKYVPNVKI